MVIADFTTACDNLDDRIPGNGIVRHEQVIGERQIPPRQLGVALTKVVGAGEIAVAPDGKILQPSNRQIRRIQAPVTGTFPARSADSVTIAELPGGWPVATIISAPKSDIALTNGVKSVSGGTGATSMV